VADPLLQQYVHALNQYADARSHVGAVVQSEDEPSLYKAAVSVLQSEAESEYVRSLAGAYLQAFETLDDSVESMRAHLAAVRGFRSQ
jgi:hypothetical protein